MRYDTTLKGKSGIYALICIPTGKMYIGKSVNLYFRLKSHVTALNCKLSKHENAYLINAWKKYGEENFKFEILEFCNKDELSKKELYYIIKYNTLNPQKGFNLRQDTESGMIPSDETRKKMSISQINRNLRKTEEEKLIEVKRSSNRWKNYTSEERLSIGKALSKSRTRHKWFQYDKHGTLIQEWDNVLDIIIANPNYKRHNIYAVASGEKPSIYGYVWKKLKI